MGKFKTETGVNTSLGYIENLPISNVFYDYDSENGEMIILE